jgi:hypothetical protein
MFIWFIVSISTELITSDIVDAKDARGLAFRPSKRHRAIEGLLPGDQNNISLMVSPASSDSSV